jgi:hypothetical protein
MTDPLYRAELDAAREDMSIRCSDARYSVAIEDRADVTLASLEGRF